MRHKQTLFIYCILTGICFGIHAHGQEAIRDSIRSAIVISDRHITRGAGTHIVSLPQIGKMIAATGESDVMKYIQILPGVSTGAEGSSAMFVRGGNMGNNVTTFDGVPIYGGSHLLGLTSSFPESVISDAAFRSGGFDAEDLNLTASHISLLSKDGSFDGQSYKVSISNFLVGGMYSAPLVKDKVSFIGSFRVSPLGPEYNLMRNIFHGPLDSLQRVRAFAMDGFAKGVWKVNPKNTISLSLFGTMDAYRYMFGDSDENMAWGNYVAALNGRTALVKDWVLKSSLSYNRYSSRQGIVRDMDGVLNNLAIISSLDEVRIGANFIKNYPSGNTILLGTLSRAAWFNPGTSATFKGKGAWTPPSSPRSDNVSRNFIQSLIFQADWSKENRYAFRISSKLHAGISDSDPDGKFRLFFNPEASLLARIHFAKWLAVEGTADWTAQHYHTLEGIPLGWSLDMMIPSDSRHPSEHSLQFYSGLMGNFGKHRITMGAYWKRMYNLVFFADASELFSSALAGWKDNIAVGEGASKGVEFLYEKDGERFSYKLSYTLSKTDRIFPDINNGNPFPAKFDRRHILNIQASWSLISDERKELGLTGLFTFQSGHWETVAAGEYAAFLPYGHSTLVDYFTSVNNYRMPDYRRLDFGVYVKWKRKAQHALNMGVFNLLNRHNPFTVTYDDRSGEWKQISLLPIMPSVRYTVEF
ncbi:MAG: hypothetical protein IKS22_01380 [Bacteroidales bacterium]|nr:hypothetical protein [Bacteroidales bacterium]